MIITVGFVGKLTIEAIELSSEWSVYNRKIREESINIPIFHDVRFQIQIIRS